MNSKTYSLFIKSSKNFILSIANFAAGVGLRVNIKNLFIRFITQMSLISSAFVAIKISTKIISIIRLTTLLLTSITKITPKINAIGQLFTGLVSDIHITTSINALMTQLILISTIMHTDKLKLNATALLGQFFILGHFDPSTIGSLDSTTLGNMDFVAT